MLTHRGQDASGLAWLESDNEIGISKKDSYPDLLKLDEEKGVEYVLGATRYPTFGTRTDSSNIEIFAQPFVCSTDYGSLVIVHNGNITNTLNLSEKNYESDSDFIVEFLGNLINEFRGDIKAAVLKFVEKVDGSYSIIGMLNDEIFSFRIRECSFTKHAY
ncbi:MAG: hypothetical protein ACXAAM_09575, partial [Candidatus Heimdallarchaeaceae archaeon]|jgi:glutamine phosphoribosylpyrophosphate amidotransferase